MINGGPRRSGPRFPQHGESACILSSTVAIEAHRGQSRVSDVPRFGVLLLSIKESQPALTSGFMVGVILTTVPSTADLDNQSRRRLHHWRAASPNSQSPQSLPHRWGERRTYHPTRRHGALWVGELLDAAVLLLLCAVSASLTGCYVRVRQLETMKTTYPIQPSRRVASAKPPPLTASAYPASNSFWDSVDAPSGNTLSLPQVNQDSAAAAGVSQPGLNPAPPVVASTPEDHEHVRSENRHGPKSRPPAPKLVTTIASRDVVPDKPPVHPADAPAPATEPAATMILEGECGDRESAEHLLDRMNTKLTRISSGNMSKSQRAAYDRVSALADRARHAFSDNDCAAASNLVSKALTLAAGMGITQF